MDDKEKIEEYRKLHPSKEGEDIKIFPSHVLPESRILKKNKKYSIIFPTRERPILLRSLLESLAVNTVNTEDIEVLIAIDNDDKTDYKFLEEYDFVQNFRVQQSMNFSEDYYNYLAKRSSGNWIITANDDCRFETRSWDVIAFDLLKKRPSTIFGWIEDGLGMYRARGQGDYCCFPLQGRGGYEALGFIFPARIPTWGADIWAAGIYKQIGSFIRLPITIKHYCHHNATRVQDEVSKRISRNQVNYSTKSIRSELEALLNALNKPKEEIEIMATKLPEGLPKWNSAHSFINTKHRKRLIMSA